MEGKLFRPFGIRIFDAIGGVEGNGTGLTPGGGVIPCTDGGGGWQSLAAHPWFLLPTLEKKLPPGWYMIEICIRSNMGRGNAKIHFDFGQGFTEDPATSLPFTNGRLSKRLHRLTARPKQIRFDPFDCPGRFSVECFKFIWVPAFFARNRMLRRLRNRHETYRGQSLRDIRHAIRAEARKSGVAPEALLRQRYSETFVENREKYTHWISHFETPEFSDFSAIRARQQEFQIRPTISVILPAHNPQQKYFQMAIKSVLEQSYPLWELCVVADASSEPIVKDVLQNYVERDNRIKAVFHNEEAGSTAAGSSALALATGDYVALLDPGDEFSPHALHFVVQTINNHPSAKLLYSDEDTIDELGNRSDPHFKPDWNPDLFFSQNYVRHLAVFQRELINKIEWFCSRAESGQEYDLIMRCLPHTTPSEIVHIPRVLYHSRMLEGSAARSSSHTNCPSETGLVALQDFFKNQGRKNLSVEPGLSPNTYRVRYPIPEPAPLVSLVIPTKDKLECLTPCVNSIIKKTTYLNYEIIIVDNQSTDHRTQAYFERIQSTDRRVRVLHFPYSFNFSAINNYAVNEARGDLICLLNNDIEVISPDWLTEMTSHALRPEIGCVGAKLYYTDETIQHAGVILGIGGVAGHSHKYFQRSAEGYFHRLKVIQNISAVTAACLLVRKNVYLKVGGFEENSLKVALNDVDFCLKVKAAGYRNLWTPYAELYHHESMSRGRDESPEKMRRFRGEIAFMKSKWSQVLARDPFYNPNLTLNTEDFSLRG